MPCYDPDTHQLPIRLRARVNDVTAMLCELCGKAEEKMPELISSSAKLSAWWDNHKAKDALLRSVELQKIQEKKAAQGFWSLTDEERDTYRRAFTGD